MLISSTFFLVITLIAFLVWATRPPKTHRNNLQSFSLNFESKRIEFAKQPNGLYQVNLCTLTFDSIEAKKHTHKAVKNANGSTTYHWQDLPLKLQKHYFTDDKAIELSDKLLTEKQATKLYFQLLKTSKSQSVCNAFYISKLIESVGKPKFFTANRVQAFKSIKSNVQARLQARKAKNSDLTPSPPLSKIGKTGEMPTYSTMTLPLLVISSLETQVFEMAQNANFDLLSSFAGIVLVIGLIYNKLHDYIENECVR